MADSWICDGIPKNGKQYSNSAAHEAYQNYGPDCAMCGLPKESSQKALAERKIPVKLIVFAVVLLGLLGAIGFGVTRFLASRQSPGNDSSPSTTTSPSTTAFVSDGAANTQLISQGEKILLSAQNSQQVSLKQSAAQAFAQQRWDEAIAKYQQASDADLNDPESKIYLNNARARAANKFFTMAVVVPITLSPDSAKEVLRGVAQYQDEHNRAAAGDRLLEVVIVNDERPDVAPALAQDLIKATNVLGVLGHGIDQNSQQAIQLYEQASLAVLSPINANLTSSSSGESLLQTSPLSQQANKLLETYLQSVGKTLVTYAQQKASPLQAAIVYNSDSPYSQQSKTSLSAAVTQANGTVVQEVDIQTQPGFDAQAALLDASNAGATVLFLALSQNQINNAVALARANAASPKPLVLTGSNELYSPSLLIDGGAAIDGIVLAVPWSFQPNDPFASQASSLWKGRVSWRTATAYDATTALVKALTQASDRASVVKQLSQGVALPNTSTGFKLFDKVPLVQAVPGSNGPQGSQYQFDPVAGF